MDKLKNNSSLKIGIHRTEENDKTEKNNFIYKKLNVKVNIGKLVSSTAKKNHERSSKIASKVASKIESSIINIKKESKSIAEIPIIANLTNLYKEKQGFINQQSSMKSEEVNEEIQRIENRISDTLNRLNTLLDKKNEYVNQQSSLKSEALDEEIEMLSNQLNRLQNED